MEKLPWIKTRFSKPYKARRARAQVQCAGILGSAVAHMNLIRFSSQVSPPEKALAIAKLQIDVAQACARAMEAAKRPSGGLLSA